MSATRLSDEDRRQVVQNLLDHRFKIDREALSAQESDLGLKIYRHVVSEEVEARIRKLPSGWVEYTNSVCAKVGSSYESFTLAKTVPKKADWGSWRACIAIVEARSELADEYQDLEAARSALRAKEEEASGAARSLLYKVSTLKRLLEVWPEVKPFTSHIAGQSERNKARELPVVQVETANALLGLPADEE